jgi:hypothetical protein
MAAPLVATDGPTGGCEVGACVGVAPSVRCIGVGGTVENRARQFNWIIACRYTLVHQAIWLQYSQKKPHYFSWTCWKDIRPCGSFFELLGNKKEHNCCCTVRGLPIRAGRMFLNFEQIIMERNKCAFNEKCNKNSFLTWRKVPFPTLIIVLDSKHLPNFIKYSISGPSPLFIIRPLCT